MELNETLTESLLHVPIVHLLFKILIQFNMEVKRWMISNGGVGDIKLVSIAQSFSSSAIQGL